MARCMDCEHFDLYKKLKCTINNIKMNPLTRADPCYFYKPRGENTNTKEYKKAVKALVN